MLDAGFIQQNQIGITKKRQCKKTFDKGCFQQNISNPKDTHVDVNLREKRHCSHNEECSSQSQSDGKLPEYEPPAGHSCRAMSNAHTVGNLTRLRDTGKWIGSKRLHTIKLNVTSSQVMNYLTRESSSNRVKTAMKNNVGNVILLQRKAVKKALHLQIPWFRHGLAKSEISNLIVTRSPLHDKTWNQLMANWLYTNWLNVLDE